MDFVGGTHWRAVAHYQFSAFSFSLEAAATCTRKQGSDLQTCAYFSKEIEAREAAATRAPQDAGENQLGSDVGDTWVAAPPFFGYRKNLVTSSSGGERRSTTAGRTSKQTSGEMGPRAPSYHPEAIERLGYA